MTANTNDNLPCLGISIDGRHIRAVEIADGAVNPLLLSVNEVEASDDLWEGVGLTESAIERLVSYLAPIIDGLPAKPASLSLALNNRLAIFKSLEVDSELPEDEKEEYLNWEMHKRLGGEREDYFIDLYPLKSGSARFDAYLAIAVKQSLLELFESLGSRLAVPLRVLDIDVFAGIDGAILADSSVASGKSAVVKGHAPYYTFSILEEGEFVYSALVRREDDGVFTLLDQTSEDIYIESILNGLNDQSDSDPFLNVDRYYVYGFSPDDVLLARLMDKGTAEKVSHFDPFKNIERGEAVMDELTAENPGRFIEVVGLAARPLS